MTDKPSKALCELSRAELARLAMAHAGDNLMVLDPDWRILYVNQTAHDLTVDGVQGQRATDLVPPESASVLATTYRHTYTTGQEGRCEVSYVDEDGVTYIYEARTSPLRLDGGDIVGIVVSSSNITDRVEERVAKLVESQKMEAIGQLAGGVAHDFNNLLMSVLGNAEYALSLLDDGHPARRHLESVMHAANLSADLTRQLLAMSRRGATRAVELDVNDRVNTTLDMLRRTIPANVRVDFAPGRGLPRAKADPAQLEQVLLNLSLNARDAMPSGGVLTLSTSAVRLTEDDIDGSRDAQPGDFVRIAVADTGTGISEAVRGRIFEPFFTTKAAGRGTGLGLTIVYEILQNHAGLIRFGEGDAGGTLVEVFLPAAAGGTPVEVASEHMPPGGDERILLVEDDALVREVVHDQLVRAGYRVTLANDGLDAMARIDAGECFDLLLLDVMMPGLDGGRVVRLLRQRNDGTPVVLMSGYSETALDSDSMLGVPLLQKPVSAEVLLRMLRHRLDRAQEARGG